MMCVMVMIHKIDAMLRFGQSRKNVIRVCSDRLNRLILQEGCRFP
jgi:hypothetical protein